MLAAAVALSLGCASDIARVGGLYLHRRQGYRIAAPGPEFERVDVEDADLAFRGPDGALMAMRSSCAGRARAPASILARHLLIGLEGRTLRQAGPVLVDRRNGWTQIFDARQGDDVVRVKTVTLVTGECVYDWVLSVGGRLDAVEADFDAWWESFHVGAPDRGARAAETGS